MDSLHRSRNAQSAKHWSADEVVQLKRLLTERVGLREIARTMMRTHEAIQVKARRLGLLKIRRRSSNPAEPS